LLSAERRFEVTRSLDVIYSVSNFELPSADDIGPGNHAPIASADRSRRLSNLTAGDRFTTLTGLAGLMMPIEWEVVETTQKAELLATRRGRYQVVSKGLQGATATIVLNVYEEKSSVTAELFVLIDEIILTGDLHHSFMTALEDTIDAQIEIVKKNFDIFQDVTVVEMYPPERRGD
jgi:hypothetical protein